MKTGIHRGTRLIALLLLLLLHLRAHSQGIVRTSLDPKRISLGESAILTVTFQNYGEVVAPPVPVISGIEVELTRSDEAPLVSSFFYTLRPREEGGFNIPRWERYAGWSLTSPKPFLLTVDPPGTVRDPKPQAPRAPPARIETAQPSANPGPTAPLASGVNIRPAPMKKASAPRIYAPENSGPEVVLNTASSSRHEWDNWLIAAAVIVLCLAGGIGAGRIIEQRNK